MERGCLSCNGEGMWPVRPGKGCRVGGLPLNQVRLHTTTLPNVSRGVCSVWGHRHSRCGMKNIPWIWEVWGQVPAILSPGHFLTQKQTLSR